MPYRVTNKDSKVSVRKALGVSLPFGTENGSDTTFTSTYQTLSMYKTNLLNYLLTGKGDRYMNPSFGNTLQRLLFGQGNLNQEQKISIQASIEEDLYYYFPKLIINEVKLEEYEDNSIQISISFTVKNTDLSDELVVDFN